MRPVDNMLDRFVRKHPKLAVPRLVQYILMGSVVVFLFDLAAGYVLSNLFAFIPDAIFHGQVWRLITFVLVPEKRGIPGFALSVFVTWWVSAAVEREWGSAKTTVFYCTGVLMNILAGLLLSGVSALFGIPLYDPTATVYYLNLSLFFTLATLLPDMIISMFGVFQFKAKWLAFFMIAYMLFDIFNGFFEARNTAGMALGLLDGALTLFFVLVAIGNYFLFFWSDIGRFLGRSRGTVKHKTSRQTINFKKSVDAAKQSKGYLHKCTVCGRTDTDSPGLEFRYCSKCNGYYCYCKDHIANHTHVD